MAKDKDGRNKRLLWLAGGKEPYPDSTCPNAPNPCFCDGRCKEDNESKTRDKTYSSRV